MSNFAYLLRGKLLFVMAAILFLSPWQPVNAALPDFKDVKCREAVQQQFSALKVLGQWSLASQREIDGSQRLFSPTQVVGVWVEAQIFLNKEVVLKRITDKFLETRTFNLNTCKVAKVTQKRAESSLLERLKDDDFSDRELRALVGVGRKASTSKGLIYLWSPHMPYSYVPLDDGKTGLENVEAVAKELGMTLTVLLDPAADRSYAQEIVRGQKGMKSEHVRAAQSVELSLRTLGNHYPVLLVYAHGKIARYGYPGVGTKSEYLQYVKGRLNELR